MSPEIHPEHEPPARPPNVLRLPVNQRGRDWFVGDMHGEIGLLAHFLDKVQFDITKDRLIAVGDLVDRGPQSLKLLEFFGANPTWFHSVLGNHDAMMRETLIYHSYDAERAWRHNGCNWIDGRHEDERRRIGQISMRMPIAIEVPLSDGRRVGVIHAEMPLLSKWDDIDKFYVAGEEAAEIGNYNGSEILWGRTRVRNALVVRKYPKGEIATPGLKARTLNELQPIAGIDLVVMGHTRLEPKIPLQCSNMLWIDTGAGYQDGCLTFVDLVAGEYAQFSHGRKRYRRAKLRRPWSLKGWQLTAEQKELAKAEELAQQSRSREILAMFGLGMPSPEKPKEKDEP